MFVVSIILFDYACLNGLCFSFILQKSGYSEEGESALGSCENEMSMFAGKFCWIGSWLY